MAWIVMAWIVMAPYSMAPHGTRAHSVGQLRFRAAPSPSYIAPLPSATKPLPASARTQPSSQSPSRPRPVEPFSPAATGSHTHHPDAQGEPTAADQPDQASTAAQPSPRPTTLPTTATPQPAVASPSVRAHARACMPACVRTCVHGRACICVDHGRAPAPARCACAHAMHAWHAPLECTAHMYAHVRAAQ